MWPEILPPNILSLELVPQTVTDNTIVLILIISFYYCKFVIHFYSPRIQLGVRTLRPEVQNNSYNTDTLPEFTSPCGPCSHALNSNAGWVLALVPGKGLRHFTSITAKAFETYTCIAFDSLEKPVPHWLSSRVCRNTRSYLDQRLELWTTGF